MAHKKVLKNSEARIIIYLNNSVPLLHYVRKISSKLNIDYGYLTKILLDMNDKGMLKREKSLANPTRTYYHLTDDGLDKVGLAIEIVSKLIEV